MRPTYSSVLPDSGYPTPQNTCTPASMGPSDLYKFCQYSLTRHRGCSQQTEILNEFHLNERNLQVSYSYQPREQLPTRQFALFQEWTVRSPICRIVAVEILGMSGRSFSFDRLISVSGFRIRPETLTKTQVSSPLVARIGSRCKLYACPSSSSRCRRSRSPGT
jgi:hypothetical protein